MTEIHLGIITLVGNLRGSHMHVTVLGGGAPGHRPLCGQVVLRVDEWAALGPVADRQSGLDALTTKLQELEQALDLATGPHCTSCGNAIDPACCWCGDGPEANHHDETHRFIPMGCECARCDRDWKKLATARGELLWAKCRELEQLKREGGAP